MSRVNLCWTYEYIFYCLHLVWLIWVYLNVSSHNCDHGSMEAYLASQHYCTMRRFDEKVQPAIWSSYSPRWQNSSQASESEILYSAHQGCMWFQAASALMSWSFHWISTNSRHNLALMKIRNSILRPFESNEYAVGELRFDLCCESTTLASLLISLQVPNIIRDVHYSYQTDS